MPLDIYEQRKPEDDLEQGDVITGSSEIKELLKCNGNSIENDIIAYIVTTQTCDLVKRNDSVKATYINLATIKDFDNILQQILNDINNKIIDNVYLSKEKNKNIDLIKRIINQNEKDYGLFYLHPNVDLTGISVRSVALLRNTFSISTQNYNVIKKNRIAGIQTDFQHKLGWLVGYLYSRVGTKDWSEDSSLNDELTQLIRDLLKEKYKWIEDEKYKHAKSKGFDNKTVTFDNVIDEIEKVQPDPPAKIILKIIEEKASELIAKSNKKLESLINEKITSSMPGDLVPSSNENLQSTIDQAKSINQNFVTELLTKLKNDASYNAPFKKC